MLTKDAVDEFMLSRGGLRPKSQKEYRKHLALFQRSFDELPETPQPVQLWVNSFPIKSEGNPTQGLEPETVHARFRTVRALYTQTHLWHPEIPDPMPLVRPPALHHKVMRTFADAELYRLFSLPLSLRDSALVTLLLDVGPRAQECANLTWPDVIPGFAVLRGKTGQRIVPISDATWRLLDRLRAQDTDSGQHVFLGERGALTYDGLYKLVRRLCKEAGIAGRRASPISFRHTFGTNYAAADGCDPSVLQDILGHADFKTTLKYIHNNARRMAVNHQRCSPLKGLAAIAQGSLFGDGVLGEAEAIVARGTGNQEVDEILERT